MAAYDHNFLKTIVPPELLESVETAVETGTFKGDGTIELSKRYKKVITIELDEQIFQKGKKRLLPYLNIKCIHGNSAEVLKTILPTLTGTTLFWLDAHFSGNSSTDWNNSMWKGFGENTGVLNNDVSIPQNQNPLNLEVEIIAKLHKGSVILYIDDIHNFDVQGNGLKNNSFSGEDWTHLNLQSLIDSVADRYVDAQYVDGYQMVIILKPIDQ